MKNKSRKELLEPFTPLAIILICTLIALVALIGLGLVSPVLASTGWTWLVYLVGSILVFLIYRARARQRKGPDQALDGRDDAPSQGTLEESPQGVQYVRKRIRQQKARKREESES
jgi:membrane protein implicated in regulation of membrane protease activity